MDSVGHDALSAVVSAATEGWVAAPRFLHSRLAGMVILPAGAPPAYSCCSKSSVRPIVLKISLDRPLNRARFFFIFLANRLVFKPNKRAHAATHAIGDGKATVYEVSILTVDKT